MLPYFESFHFTNITKREEKSEENASPKPDSGSRNFDN